MGTELLSTALNPTTALQQTEVKRTFYYRGRLQVWWMGEPVMERKQVPRDTLHTAVFQQEERDATNSHEKSYKDMIQFSVHQKNEREGNSWCSQCLKKGNQK